MVASVEVEQSSSQWAGQCNGGGPVSTAVNVRLRLLCVSWTCAVPATVRRVVGRQKNSQYSRRLSQQAESPSSEKVHHQNCQCRSGFGGRIYEKYSIPVQVQVMRSSVRKISSKMTGKAPVNVWGGRASPKSGKRVKQSRRLNSRQNTMFETSGDDASRLDETAGAAE